MKTITNVYGYHVTTYDVAKHIIDEGAINPAFSQGKNTVSWYVAKSKVTWAMAHVCQRHSCQIEDLAILTIKVSRDDLKRSNKPGVYWTTKKLRPIEMVSASIWLQREERRVLIPRNNRGRKRIEPDDDE